MSLICYNGIHVPEHEPLLHVSNRAFRYGDGLFETIRVSRGAIPLASYHFSRLFQGMELMKLPAGKLSAEYLTGSILELCQANHCGENARVRLEVFRTGEGDVNFLIEALSLPGQSRGWNEEGLLLGIFPDARKATDKFSNLKSCNYLPYTMADMYAKENQLDDAVVINCREKVADTSRANIFILKEGQCITPSTDQGCVAGVMRAFLLDNSGIPIEEKAISIDDMLAANEVFLTNAVFGIRRVRQFLNKTYTGQQAEKIYRELVTTIFP